MNTCEVHFSPQEKKILSLISQHYTYEKIYTDVGISPKTLYKYIEIISKKIGLKLTVGKRARQDITRYAIEHGYGKIEAAS